MTNTEASAEDFARMLIYAADCIRYTQQVQSYNDCNNCARGCGYEPKWGAMTRINCPLWRAKDETDRS